MTHSNTEMANVFNNYFASVYTREDISSIPSFHLDHTVPTLNDVDITPSIVLDRLEKINVNKSSRPDGWPLLSLKETALQLSVPLCILFKKSVVAISLVVGNTLMSHQFTRREIVLLLITTVQ